jgi:hypothetical protein
LGRLFIAGKQTEEKDEEAGVVNWRSTALEVCETKLPATAGDVSRIRGRGCGLGEKLWEIGIVSRDCPKSQTAKARDKCQEEAE